MVSACPPIFQTPTIFAAPDCDLPVLLDLIGNRQVINFVSLVKNNKALSLKFCLWLSGIDVVNFVCPPISPTPTVFSDPDFCY